MIRTSAVLLLLLFFCNTVFAGQKDSTRVKNNPYKLNYYTDIPISVAGLLASKYGTDYLRDRKPKNMDRVATLTPGDVWFFDRSSARINPEDGEEALETSNIFLRAGMWSPLLMYIDPKIRDLGFDFALLHIETQAINAAAYLAASIPVPRLRPFMYNPDVSMEKKMGDNTTNSFFSGHASVVAASTFFMVKVYYDVHPQAKNKGLFYGLACVPPAITGYLRYKGAKHFPSDIITGFAVGAATGILVPEFHKRKAPLRVYPVSFMDKGLGVTVLYTLR